MDSKKQKLIAFLERRVWQPILRASPGRYSVADQQRLERVKRKTETQQERYYGYESAGQVRQEFQDDLTSQPAKRVNADLKKLHLPVQRDVADEFFALADALGIAPERPAGRAHKPHPPHPWHKSTPEARENAKRELMKQAREGNREAIETLRSAPAKWARDYARDLTHRSDD